MCILGSMLWGLYGIGDWKPGLIHRRVIFDGTVRDCCKLENVVLCHFLDSGPFGKDFVRIEDRNWNISGRIDDTECSD